MLHMIPMLLMIPIGLHQPREGQWELWEEWESWGSELEDDHDFFQLVGKHWNDHAISGDI